MFRLGPYSFKFAEAEAEFEQVHALNYRTFVREIAQHHDTGDGRLIDRFHDKNRYVIALRDGRVVGMLSVHDRPPFSVAVRMPDPSLLARPEIKPLEVRLFAVEPAERSGPVAAGLVWLVYLFARHEGYTHLFISGVTGQLPLYKHIGFEPLGPPVTDGAAAFVPMWLPVERVEETMGRGIELWRKRLARSAVPNRPVPPPPGGKGGEERPAPPSLGGKGDGGSGPPEPVCLLPGPVAIAPAVRAAFHGPLIYHRADEFLALFERVRSRLSDLVGGKKVAVQVGSGTLANDMVAATLAADPRCGNGLVLVNGEFGERLLRQARRMGLAPRTLAWGWGRPWDLAAVEAAFRTAPPGGWVWAVHHETSTGVLNDVRGLTALAGRYSQRVCLDCVSSIGSVPLDLSGVYLASAASGKALGSYAGLAFVFADPADLAHLPAEAHPTYLDVPAGLAVVGPRFTVPSPLVTALDAALEPFATPGSRGDHFRHVCRLGRQLRAGVRESGLVPLAPDHCAGPAVVTFAPPAGESAPAFVARCRRAGFLIGGQSGYLAERGLVQIAVMGDVTAEHIDRLFAKLRGTA